MDKSIANSLQSRWAAWQTPQMQLLIGLIAPTIVTGMTHHSLTVALPAIRRDFVLDADTTAWVVLAYTLPFMALMPLYGRLGDGLGKRRLLIFGMSLFLVGVVVAIVAPTLPFLLLGRFIQGLGTAGFVPLCIALISQRFAPQEQGRVMGTWNSAIPLMGLTVPYLGGLLVDALGWRAIYPPILVVGLLAIVVIRHNIQPLTQQVDVQLLRTFDWGGVLLLSGALVSLLFYTASRLITGVPALQDFRLLTLCIVLFGGLIFWEQRRSNPYVSLAIFGPNTFTLASVCAGLRMFLMTSMTFLLALYLTDIHQSSASLIGFVLALQAGGLFAISRAGGQVADRWGSRVPVTLSMLGLLVTMAGMAVLPATAPLWPILVAAMAHGLIIGLSLAPLHRAAMQGIDQGEIGAAAGMYSMIRFAGSLLGTAIAGVLLQRGLERLPLEITAYQQVFWAFAVVALLGTILGWFLREPEEHSVG